MNGNEEKFSLGVGIGILTSLAVIASFACIIVGAGHGAIPIGGLMIGGEGDWKEITIPSWISIACLLCADVLPLRKVRAIVGYSAIFGIVSCWAAFLWISEFNMMTVAISFPFLLFILVKCYYHLARLRGGP